MTKHLLLAVSLAAALFGTGPALALASGVAIVVPARDIARGEVIAAADLTTRNVDAASVVPGTVIQASALAGMQARRVLQAGSSVRNEDVRAPILVTKGQTVTMTFAAPGIELTALGRAMSEGGLGETVTVQNPASFRLINAAVTGAGTVAAASTATNIAAK